MYKKIISAWLNESKNKDGEKYLSIKNVSDEDVVIPAGQSLFLNMTPKDIREKFPNTPLFSKSVKVEDQEQAEKDDISDDIPF
jgi:hypothetical protein